MSSDLAMVSAKQQARDETAGISVYLQDHLAEATSAIRLMERMAELPSGNRPRAVPGIEKHRLTLAPQLLALTTG